MSTETWTVLQLLTWASDYFKSHNIHPPRPTAEILLAHVLSFNRVDLYIQYDRPVNPRELAAFKETIKRRLRGEPVAYIVGERGFWSLDLRVTPDVLIPRPETEIVVETALAVLPKKADGEAKKILDIGTGSGAIVLALATERPGYLFYATDRSWKALRVARENARKYRLEEGVRFFCGDLFKPLAGVQNGFDLIVSNPPYIRRGELNELASEVSKYEPREALDGGPDGLDLIRILVRQAPEFIAPQGWLIFEIGYDQGEDVKCIMAGTKAYEDVTILTDYNNLNRVVRARLKGNEPQTHAD